MSVSSIGAPVGSTKAGSSQRQRLFWQGFVILVTNAKSLTSRGVLSPNQQGGADIAQQLFILSLTFFVIATVLTAVFAILAGHVRQFVTGGAIATPRNRISGALVVLVRR